jgi:hypothetical protein
MGSMQRHGSTVAGRRRVRRLRVVGFALMALGAFPVGGTFGATSDAAGWWSQTSSPLPLNPTAPHVGEGQLHVQGQPGGPTAVAALRWTLAETESAPVLTLTAADGSLVPPEAHLVACRAATPWQEAHGGAWDEAPEADCATSVDGVVAEDRSTIELALGPLVDGTSLDVVLLPGEAPGGGGSTFSLTFDRPGPESLVTTTSSGTETAGGGFASTAPQPSSSSSSPGVAVVPPPAPASPAFAAPATEAVSPPPPEETAAPPPAAPEVAAARPAAAERDGSDRAQSLGLVVLLAGAAVVAWAWMASAPAEPMPERAGAEAPSSGLGRFTAARRAAPPATP